jgi:hypothetical protein
MPKVAPTVMTTTTQEVELKPALRRKLLTELEAYADLQMQEKLIRSAMDEHKAEITKLREMTGENSLSLEGFKTTWVTGTTSSLDKKKLIALGVTMAQIEEATVTKPRRGFEKITCPGQDGGEE